MLLPDIVPSGQILQLLVNSVDDYCFSYLLPFMDRLRLCFILEKKTRKNHNVENLTIFTILKISKWLG